MPQREEQPHGRSTPDERDLSDRDARDVGEAGDAGATRVPMPNEEGTNFRAGQPGGRDADAQGDGDEGGDEGGDARG